MNSCEPASKGGRSQYIRLRFALEAKYDLDFVPRSEAKAESIFLKLWSASGFMIKKRIHLYKLWFALGFYVKTEYIYNLDYEVDFAPRS